MPKIFSVNHPFYKILEKNAFFSKNSLCDGQKAVNLLRRGLNRTCPVHTSE